MKPENLFEGDFITEAEAAEIANEYWSKRQAGDMEGANAAIKRLKPSMRCHTNARGNLVRSISFGDDRYQFDFDREMQRDDWEQYDTSQDASYFGVWINKKKLLVLTYAEGDLSLVNCHDTEHFNTEIESMNEFYEEGFIAKCFSEDGIEVLRQDRGGFLVENNHGQSG